MMGVIRLVDAESTLLRRGKRLGRSSPKGIPVRGWYKYVAQTRNVGLTMRVTIK
jgi:hypothetical protein